MKKVLFVLMLAFTLIFTSCVREESNLQTEFELTSEEFYNKVNDSFQYGFYYSKPIVIKFTETNPDMEIISKACYDFSIPLKITFDFSDCAELSEIPANWFKESLYYTDFTFIFPESLETINDYAFYGLRATKKSPIPNGVKTLGTGCYPYYSDYINSITIPSSVETLSEGIFEYYSNLESIIFPEDCKITEIPANAFHGCYNLKRINIPTSVTKIGEQAFYNSGKLENVKLPDNLTSEISRLTFAATEIGTLTIPGTYKKLDNSNFNSTTIDNVILEEGIEYLGSDLFGYGSNLKTITIPSSVTYISPLFNRSCEKLEEIVLADGNTVYSYDISGALKSIYNNSGDFSIQNYPGAKKDKKVTIGDGIHRIERACFFNNPYIEEIVIGPDVLQLCDWCFYECLNVKTIRFTRTSDIETSYDLSDTMFGSSSSTNKPKEITVIVPKGTLGEYQKVFEREKPDQTITFNLIEE